MGDSTAFRALTWWVITDIKQQGKDYLYSVTVTSVSPIMRLILSTVLVLALSSVTLGIFFNTPRTSCSSNRQCRSFSRTQCLGTDFILCFGQTRSYTVPGLCVQRSNILCDIGNALGGRDNCRYNECAECLERQDCGYSERCSNNRCVRRSRPSRRN